MPAEDSAIQVLVRDSIDFLKQGNAKEASRLINLALKLDVTNPDLQFLNGLTYHLMGVLGDASKFELAEQGYKQSLKFDPGNLPSRYQLGLLYMDQRRYPLAQENFAAVALHHNNDPAVLYSLASASYYSRDPRTAAAALKRLMEISPEARENPEILKAAALALSAMDDRSSAQEFITTYRDVIKDVNRARDLDRRVEGWQSFYESEGKYIQAQFSGSRLSNRKVTGKYPRLTATRSARQRNLPIPSAACKTRLVGRILTIHQPSSLIPGWSWLMWF